ncbi:hypothetical protein HAHE_12380 [Haloferula helveola]|uniref:DUF4159 domain-containing protein n=1 Tax=Haloferula helveola TaxID=490095 RepID=A0ABM7RD88_9BACT|nr:hypothetical protein HAHE_12380 [Haloferula helveola]
MKRIALIFSLLVAPLVADEAQRIKCGNLVYGKGQTSVCFADAFLKDAARETGIDIDPSFSRIALAKPELFKTPMCVFTGEGDFQLTPEERKNLKRYLENGGFIMASPGCSDADWNRAFQREISAALPEYKFAALPMDHELFSTVHKITEVRTYSKSVKLQGLQINGRLALLYSPEGLNDVRNASGCCCCGGSEIQQSRQVNVNALVYALLH